MSLSQFRFLFLGFVWMAFASSQSFGAWVKVDDFETLVMTGAGGTVLLNTEGTNGPHTNNLPGPPEVRVPFNDPSDGGWFVKNGGDENGTNDRNWTVITDPEDPSNKVLSLEDEYDSSLVKPIPGGGIAQGAQGTLYFRYYSRAGESPTVGAGLIDDASDGDPGNSGPYVNTNDGSTGADNATLLSYSEGGGSDGGGSSTTLASGMAESVWYSIWMQIDHTNSLPVPPNPNTLDANDPGNPLDGGIDGTFSVYIAGGAFGSTPVLLGSDLQFRQNPIGDLTSVILRPNNNNTHDGDSVYFDDIYVSDTLTLDVPGVPEPGTFALAISAILGLLAVRIRK